MVAHKARETTRHAKYAAIVSWEVMVAYNITSWFCVSLLQIYSSIRHVRMHVCIHHISQTHCEPLICGGRARSVSASSPLYLASSSPITCSAIIISILFKFMAFRHVSTLYTWHFAMWLRFIHGISLSSQGVSTRMQFSGHFKGCKSKVSDML